MCSIYTRAYLTIAADRAGGNSDGLFTRLERQHVPISLSAPAPQLPSFKPGVDASDTSAFAFLVPAIKACLSRDWLELDSEPLSKRAWALQERMLPHRILHFASDQMYFECNHSFVSEDGHCMSGRYRSLYSGEQEPAYQEIARFSRHSTNHQLWYLLLENLTGRVLTVDSDRLPSISGLARLFETRLREQSDGSKVEYLAGLWSDSVIEGLGWQSMGTASLRRKHGSGGEGAPPPMPPPWLGGLPGAELVMGELRWALRARDDAARLGGHRGGGRVGREAPERG
jgi:hypothetical protein